MNNALQACFALMAQAMLQCAAMPPAQAASSQPVWTNDNVADTVTFNDGFGHNVLIGSYNPATGAWTPTSGGSSVVTSVCETFTGGLVTVNGSCITSAGTFALTVAGTGGGIPYFNSGTTWQSTGVLPLFNLMLGGGVNGAPYPLGSLGTTTQVLHGNAAGNPSWGAVSVADVTTALTTPPPIGLTTPSNGVFTGQTRSLQSFGAAGDGVTDDTTNVQTALNSGVPLACNGKFIINSLVTMTNVNVAMFGGGGPGCTIILNNAQSELYATLTGASNYNSNTFKMHDVKISVAAVITSVTGPAQTAALYITYPAGTAGDNLPLVDIDNVSVKPTTTSNYILNGIYLNDVTGAWIKNYMYEGKVSAVDANSTAIVFDGTHSPTNLRVIHSYADLVGTGIAAITHATNAWQGIRINGFDCVFCKNIVNLAGGGDGFSDYADLAGVEGAFDNSGISVTNVTHVTMHNNYVFMSNVPGITTPAFPTCFTDTWSVTLPANGEGSNVSDNTCDGVQITGYTGRFGFNLGGKTNMNDHLGVNELSNLDTGISTASGTSGWALEKQRLKNVTTEWTANETAGSETLYPPFAVTDGSAQAAGLVGEVISSSVASPGTSLVNNTAANVTSVALTKGDYDCRGEVDFTGTATTLASLRAGIFTTTAAFSTAPAFTNNLTNSGVVAPSNNFVPLAPFVVNISANTTEFLNASALFSGGTQTAYGRLECRRMR